MSNSLDDMIRKTAPKFPEPKNLRLLLDLRLISKDSDASTASLAWSHLVSDPLVVETEKAYPGEREVLTRPALAGHYKLREDVVRKIVAEMPEEEREALRKRLLARRVTTFQTPAPTSAGVLKI